MCWCVVCVRCSSLLIGRIVVVIKRFLCDFVGCLWVIVGGLVYCVWLVCLFCVGVGVVVKCWWLYYDVVIYLMGYV